MRVVFAPLKKLLLTASLSQQSWLLCSKTVVVNALCYSPLCLYILGVAVPFQNFLWCFFVKKKKKSYELGPPPTHPPKQLPDSWHSAYETEHGEFWGGINGIA